MGRFTPTEKLQAAQEYINGGVSYRDLEKRLNIDNSVIRYWVQLYTYHGEQAFHFLYTNYTAAFKLKIVQFIEKSSYSIRAASAIFQIPDPSMVRRWKKKWKKGGMAALESPKERAARMSSEETNNQKNDKKDQAIDTEAIQKEVEYLRMENAYLKKLRNLNSRKGKITKSEKTQVVNELRSTYPFHELIKMAGLSRSNFYYHLSKINKPDPDQGLKERIMSIYHKHKGRYGYRRVQQELENTGHHVNHKKVYRLMKELSLSSVVRVKKYKSYKGKVGQIAQNLLERAFEAEFPNQKWVTDITEFKVFGEKLYLSTVLDLYNGEVIGYTIGHRPTYSLVEKMLYKALGRLKEGDDLLLHSDQGWHYQMPQYRTALKEYGVTQSMSRKGNCLDNAVMENFFGIMKSEFLYISEFNSVDHFKQELDEYMHYYNHDRIKSKLKTSPISYREKHQLAA
ncbi:MULTISPECIES: IS3 family transposase [Pontibacillus]|uniref:IS3 family transposase n=1 Tax=Pontibacillus chungwhensis TaxID=265426 RepID=A0ABY8V1T1_9BACI|nr:MULTISPECIES: IS3 family transposase [Pontibacillus]MCD5326170.1 IS3 family transposase [Pontibacillus sp. HN14]WIF97998.1 IS3 family transposase [Pontibacillus chungwhensis]WIF99403.1 IS3 family transposase [Pontibacillus chungwhensis]